MEVAFDDDTDDVTLPEFARRESRPGGVKADVSDSLAAARRLLGSLVRPGRYGEVHSGPVAPS